MARSLRIEYPGAVYHITSRGNERRPIFSDDYDRRIFLQTLKEVIETHNVFCYAYCLMDNHYHLLFETNDPNLSKAMRDLNSIYTQRFNKRHKRVGHLFQGRYKAFLVEKDLYLLELTRYVVLNPVRANMVAQPEDWRWSSYRATTGLSACPVWLDVDWVLALFTKQKRKAQSLYKTFVKDGIDAESPFAAVREGMILGSEQFVSWIYETTDGSEETKEFPRSERIIGRPSLDDIFEGKVDRLMRNEAMHFARQRCGYLISEIAKHLDIDPSTVGKIVRSEMNRIP